MGRQIIREPKIERTEKNVNYFVPFPVMTLTLTRQYSMYTDSRLLHLEKIFI